MSVDPDSWPPPATIEVPDAPPLVTDPIVIGLALCMLLLAAIFFSQMRRP